MRTPATSGRRRLATNAKLRHDELRLRGGESAARLVVLPASSGDVPPPVSLFFGVPRLTMYPDVCARVLQRRSGDEAAGVDAHTPSRHGGSPRRSWGAGAV